MATTERPDEHVTADRVAASLGDADFVSVVAAPRGDTLAALGVLCRALDDRNVPFQAAVRRTVGDGTEDADETVSLGLGDADATHSLASDPVTDAYEIASVLSTPDALLGVAGLTAREPVTTGRIDDATAAGLSRRPGLAIPTPDPVDGLAHSTLVHGSFSGDGDAADAVVGEFEATEDAWRRLASDVALAVAESAPPESCAGTALERILRPHVGGPLETVGGFADVLDALARHAPGVGIAAVLGDVDSQTTLDVWRSHAQTVHEAVAAAELRRHDGLVTVDTDVDGTTAEPVARLLRDYRSPEPAVLVVGHDRSTLAVADEYDAASLLRDCVGDHVTVAGHDGLASTAADSTDVETDLRTALGGGS